MSYHRGSNNKEPPQSPLRKNASLFQTFIMHCKDRENPELYRTLSPAVHVARRASSLTCTGTAACKSRRSG